MQKGDVHNGEKPSFLIIQLFNVTLKYTYSRLYKLSGFL